jgi:excisionase family DNA binding protein
MRHKKRPAEVLVEKRLLTPAELAASLNVPIWKARSLWQAGKIPVIRLGHRTVRFDFAEVLKALQDKAA